MKNTALSKNNWFSVDTEGLREMHSGFPPARIVSELVQNSFDEASTRCTVQITEGVLGRRNTTCLVVEDDNPEGFKDLRHAFTLFASTSKRADAEKRGRYNLGEKIVFARSLTAKVETTKGTLVFDEKGRRQSATGRAAGSVITAVFPRWSAVELREAQAFLKRINPPACVAFVVNGEVVLHREAEIVRETILPTELLREVDGVMVMSKTRRKTTIGFQRKMADEAFIYEMGIPVAPIDGGWDADVAQKIPLSHDRTTVSLTFLKEIYAELLNALQGREDVSDLGAGIIKVALESDRITPETAADTFRKIYGAQSVIQAPFAPDANQEAARANYAIISGRTFGAEVNEKLRLGGIQTSVQVFGRDAINPSGALADDVELVPIGPEHHSFLAYARMLVGELFKDDPAYRPSDFKLELAHIDRSVAGVNCDKTRILFNVDSITDFAHPISAATHLILHEVSHAFGNQHDGVYDHATERLVNRAFALLAAQPGKFRAFEPSLFPAAPATVAA